MNGVEGGADLIYELSGNTSVLNLAMDLCAYSGRIVIGSWYGSKTADLKLGGRFHRNRLQLISSQVSTISPELSGRWNKTRRYETAWAMIRTLQAEHLVSHRMAFESAVDAYQLLDKSPEDVLQTILEY
jgi:threonine dehydrogenase-like Zn-dependent dehydrogenase